MKKILLLALFVVTWKAYEAKGTFAFYPEVGTNNGCVVQVVDHEEKFADEMEALARYTSLKMGKMNFDIEIYEEKRRQIKP